VWWQWGGETGGVRGRCSSAVQRVQARGQEAVKEKGRRREAKAAAGKCRQW